MKAIAQMQRRIALTGVERQETIALYEVEKGRYAAFPPASKARILAAARWLDVLATVKSATDKAKQAETEAAAKRKAALEDIARAALDLATPYARAEAEINAWRDTAVQALQGVGLATEEYAVCTAAVHAIATERLARAAAEEAERRLRASRHWRDGAARGLRDYAKEAGDAAAQAEDAMTGAMRGMEDALVAFVRTGKLSFRSLADSIIADIARMTIRQLIAGPLASAASGLLRGLFGGNPFAGGRYAGAARGTYPIVPVYSAPLPALTRHAGGIAGSLSGVRRAVPPELFSAAPRYHRGSIAGMVRPNEVPTILEWGEEVLPASDPRHRNNLAPPQVHIEFVNQGTAQREIDREVRFDGRRWVVSVFLNDLHTGGPMSQAIRGALR